MLVPDVRLLIFKGVMFYDSIALNLIKYSTTLFPVVGNPNKGFLCTMKRRKIFNDFLNERN